MASTILQVVLVVCVLVTTVALGRRALQHFLHPATDDPHDFGVYVLVAGNVMVFTVAVTALMYL